MSSPEAISAPRPAEPTGVDLRVSIGTVALQNPITGGTIELRQPVVETKRQVPSGTGLGHENAAHHDAGSYHEVADDLHDFGAP